MPEFSVPQAVRVMHRLTAIMDRFLMYFLFFIVFSLSVISIVIIFRQGLGISLVSKGCIFAQSFCQWIVPIENICYTTAISNRINIALHDAYL